MKKMIISLTLLLFMVESFSQTPAFSKDYYLKKSKNQKTVAWVMLGGGLAITAIFGFRKDVEQQGINVDPLAHRDAPIVLAGIASALGSIPFFISSAKNKGRALSVAIRNKKILVPQQKGYALHTQPSLTLRLTL